MDRRLFHQTVEVFILSHVGRYVEVELYGKGEELKIETLDDLEIALETAIE